MNCLDKYFHPCWFYHEKIYIESNTHMDYIWILIHVTFCVCKEMPPTLGKSYK